MICVVLDRQPGPGNLELARGVVRAIVPVGFLGFSCNKAPPARELWEDFGVKTIVDSPLHDCIARRGT